VGVDGDVFGLSAGFVGGDGDDHAFAGELDVGRGQSDEFGDSEGGVEAAEEHDGVALVL